MKVLLSRLRFGVTNTYHFLFVPLSIGLAPLVAVFIGLWLFGRNRLSPLGHTISICGGG
jgi:cytochrome bd-type quinol oxidase subunit 1